jgi:hypothetical protein
MVQVLGFEPVKGSTSEVLVLAEIGPLAKAKSARKLNNA